MRTTPAPVAGHVTAFDAGRGTGVVRGDDGAEWTFHATRVSDGSRSVEVGRRVVFEVGIGAHPGSWEATRVVKI